MKSLTWLHDLMLQECGIRCGTDTHLDRRTLLRRTEHEGDSFLSIALPSFCRDFESCLERGQVDSQSFQGFRKRWALPAFLRGLTSQVFDPKCGKLLAQPSHEAVLSIRQVCLLKKKVLKPCTPERVGAAMEAFVQVEKELTDLLETLSDWELSQFEKLSGMLWGNVLGEVVEEIENFALIPKHGPGATAEKVLGNSKYRLKKWHSRLQVFFPIDAYGLSCPDANQQEGVLDEIEFVEPDAEQPVRVVAVPKTLRAPRIIAIEPVCMQYTQQAVARALVRTLERNPLTSGHINFSNQGINRELAQDSSKSRNYATVDLSEASDRVHADLVGRMLGSVPTLRDAVFACRSTRAALADDRIVTLTKFASMGSALCFPIESMVFYTLCIYARLIALNLPTTPRNIKKVSRRVYVYGDDLIVPADEVRHVANTLSLFGLKVNAAKTFGVGKFRESCGMDAFDGVDVTPVYLRRELPRNKQQVPEVISSVAFANQLYFKGWWTTAKRVREVVESVLGQLPHVRDTSPCLGWLSVNQRYSYSRTDPELHAPRVKGYVVKAVEQSDPLSGHAALMKCLLKAEEGSFNGEADSFRQLFDGPTALFEHLERTVRSGSARIKYRWAQPF